MRPMLIVFSIDVISKSLLGILGIFLIRFMPENEYAKYTLVLSLVMLITQALSCSFNRIYIIGYKSFKLEENSRFLGFQFLSLVALAVLATPFKAITGNMYWLVVILTSGISLSEFTKTVFQQELNFIRFSMVEIFSSTLFFIGVIFLIKIYAYTLEAWEVITVQATATFVIFILFFINRINIHAIFKISNAWFIARTVIKGKYKYLFGYFSVLAFFSQIDIFFLKALANDSVLATYGSAYRYYGLLLLSLGAVNSVLLPTVQRVNCFQDWNKIHMKLNKLLIAFALLALICVWASQWIIPLVDKGKYPDAILVFRILAISAIISFAFSPHVNLIMRFEDFEFLFGLICFAVVLSASLNILLIPKFHAIGSAVATFVGFGFINISIFVRSFKYKKMLLHNESC